MNCEERYWSAIEAFVTKSGGSRYEIANEVARYGVWNGRTVEGILSDLESRMTLKSEHRYNIRRSFSYWTSRIGMDQFNFRPWQSPRERAAPSIDTTAVRKLIARGGGISDSGALMDISPISVKAMSGQEQTQLFFSTLWHSDDLLYVTRSGPEIGILGRNIRTAEEWLDHIKDGRDLGGEIVTPNPLTGESVQRHGRDGEYRSFICKDCLARPMPYILMEMDELQLKEQAAFWLGFIKGCPLASALASLTYSGSRSIHGLLCVNALTEESRNDYVQRLVRLYSCDPETFFEPQHDGNVKKVYPYRIDAAAMRPLTKTRIPGVRRAGTNQVQKLLFLNPSVLVAH